MATKTFCDRCGDESTDTQSRRVFGVTVTRNGGTSPGNPFTVDLCGDCYAKLKRFTELQPHATPSQGTAVSTGRGTVA